MKRILTFFTLLTLTIFLLDGCVAKRKYLDSQIALRYSKNDSLMLATKVNSQQDSISGMEKQIYDLNKKISDLTNQNSQLSSDISNQQMQIGKSKQELASQQERLEQLQRLLDAQKEKLGEIKKKMTDALVGFNANDLTITQKNGKVYVSLSENLLFPSGSAVVNPKGKVALKKLADVLNVNSDINVDIEGHTDTVPIHGKYQDNWALSTARATSIVRILVNDYKVDPVRVEATGHSQYNPVATNSTPEGRALNRRTEIILSPKLDELYKLIEQNGN